MTDTKTIIKNWCAACGMPEPSDGECHALEVALATLVAAQAHEAAPAAQGEPSDPLQGAANWLLAAIRRLGEKAEARAADPFGEDGRLFFVASAAPSDETLRLAGVIADKIEDGTLFQAGIFSRRDLADKIRAVVRFARQGVPPAALESAPVAGEVQPVAYRVLRKQHDGEWVTDGRAWCDGVPTQDLVDDIALRSDGWRIEYAFAAPTAQDASHE